MERLARVVKYLDSEFVRRAVGVGCDPQKLLGEILCKLFPTFTLQKWRKVTKGEEIVKIFTNVGFDFDRPGDWEIITKLYATGTQMSEMMNGPPIFISYIKESTEMLQSLIDDCGTIQSFTCHLLPVQQLYDIFSR